MKIHSYKITKVNKEFVLKSSFIQQIRQLENQTIKTKKHPWVCRKMILKLFPFFKMKKNRKPCDNQLTAKPLKLYVIWRIEYQDKVNQNKQNTKY